VFVLYIDCGQDFGILVTYIASVSAIRRNEFPD
jgi:hypothetical protein